MPAETHVTDTNLNTLRHATEARDTETLVGLYADDAELQIVDRLHPPSNPLVLRGKAAIHPFLADINAREMTHRIEREIAGADRWAFTEACQYPDGTRVLVMTTADVRDGKIVRQTNVQAWDE